MGLPKLTKERINAKLTERGRIDIICVGNNVNGYKAKTNWLCLVCDHTWDSMPHTIVVGNHGCPKCSNVSEESIDKKLLSTNKNITRLSPVTYNKAHVEWQCNVCMFSWKTSPNSIFSSNTGCPKCINRARLTNEIVDIKLHDLKLPIQRIGEVLGTHKKTTWRCMVDDQHTWEAVPASVLGKRQTGCPLCYAERNGGGTPTTVNGIRFRSRLEAETYKELIQRLVDKSDIVLQKRYNTTTRHTCDFYIPSKKLWIEVSTYTRPEYLLNIEKKRNWIENIHEQFCFISSPKQLPF
jgi:predicted nucleic-acid-binding Zn-ribbon protein